MSTRSTSSNLFSPLRDPENLIRRKNLGEPSSLFDFEEVMSIPHNNQGSPTAGPPPPQNNNGPPLVMRPNGLAPQSMEELCQQSINGQDGPIAPIPIQATDFGLHHHMIQQVQKSCQFHGLPGDDADRHIDKFLEITQYMKQNGVSDDALRLSLFPYSLTHHATAWYDRLPGNSIHTFDDMMRKFLSKYFPPSMINTMRTEIKNDFETSMAKNQNDLKNMMSSFLQMQMQSPLGPGSFPSNTIANPRGDVKAITTRSSVAYDEPMIPPTSSPLPKVVERETEATKDKVQNTSSESTTRVQPLVVQVTTPEAVVVPKPNPKPSIPYSSRLNDQNLREKNNSQMLNGPPKKLPEKLRDPRRFLIPYDFQGFESCMALADLGASINLMPLSVWKKLSLPDLTHTCMTLKLATRSFAYPAGIAEDVFMQVSEFTFLADFIVIDYNVDPRVPLILRRPFLRTDHALVDVRREELILRDSDEQLIFHADSTLKHPHKHRNESINMINFINITCEDHFSKVLKFKKLNHPLSGSTTPLSDFPPSLTPLETSDSLLKEFTNELALLDPFPPETKDNDFDFKADLREIEFLLNQDPSTESNIETIDPIFEKFTNEPTSAYLPLLRDDDDDIFDLKSNNDEWK
nr:reverse transcriptase domain-containing protein [Tanacetum cinerariifolium]